VTSAWQEPSTFALARLKVHCPMADPGVYCACVGQRGTFTAGGIAIPGPRIKPGFLALKAHIGGFVFFQAGLLAVCLVRWAALH